MERLIATALAALAFTGCMLLLKASVIAWNLWFMHARPALCGRIYDAYTGRPVRATLVGLVNTAVLFSLALVLIQFEPLALIAILLFAGLAAIHIWGRTACYRTMAERLGGEPGVPPPVRSLLRGAVITELAFLVPVLGQLLYIGVTIRCAGAFIIGVIAGWSSDEPA